jgi:hypothetical protein
MKKPKPKTYTPAARHNFIRVVSDRAHLLGLSEGHSEPSGSAAMSPPSGNHYSSGQNVRNDDYLFQVGYEFIF